MGPTKHSKHTSLFLRNTETCYSWYFSWKYSTSF